MMPKIAFIFPGQGSQEIGMGKDLLANFKEAKDLFQEANHSLKDEAVDLKRLCLKGPEDELARTANAQPAILTVSTILSKLLQKNNIMPDVVAGHSLGEYSALVTASSIGYRDAVKLVRKRGKFMQTATPYGFGLMAAIISFNRDKIEEIIKIVSKSGTMEIANYNSPYQVVVSGKREAIEKLLIIGEKDEEVNIVPLKVSAPFHSSYMKKAKESLAQYLESIDIYDSQIPLICNVTADYVKTKEEIKNALIEQMTHPVRWMDIISRINTEGIDCFVEVGPGNVLKKLIKQMIPKAKVYNVCDSESLRKATIELG